MNAELPQYEAGALTLYTPVVNIYVPPISTIYKTKKVYS